MSSVGSPKKINFEAEADLLSTEPPKRKKCANCSKKIKQFGDERSDDSSHEISLSEEEDGEVRKFKSKERKPKKR